MTILILNTQFVVGINSLKVYPVSGVKDGRKYSSVMFPFEKNTKNGIIFLPRGGIFELKYPSNDIVGTAV